MKRGRGPLASPRLSTSSLHPHLGIALALFSCAGFLTGILKGLEPTWLRGPLRK